MAIDAERYSKTWKRTIDLLEEIAERYRDFDYYKDTTFRNLARPAVFWADGRSLGYGSASHMAGSAQKFYDKFKYLGFDDLEDYYCLPLEKRNEFLERGKAFWEATFREGEFSAKMDDILNIERLDYQRQEEILASIARAEEEFHGKLVYEAKQIKKECYGNRRLRWRIRNEKARFKAEDKLRDRTRYTYCGSCLTEGIWLFWFELQERLKKLFGLRE